MKTASGISLFSGWLLASLAAQAQAPTYTLAFANNPPFSATEKGQPKGVAVAIIQELFGRAKLPYQFVELPLARAKINATTQARYCVFPIQRAQDIETDYQWISPILVTRSGLFVRPDSPLQFVTLADARNLTIGALRGSGDAEYLRSFGFRVEEVNTQEQNLEKLFARRFDVWATDVLSAMFFTRKFGGGAREALRFRVTLSSLACNLDMPADHLAKLQDTLDAMIEEGTLQRLTSSAE